MNARSRLPAGPQSLSVMFLLCATLVLTLILAWQAQESARRHLAAAENALREYAFLAADEFVRRSLVELGFRGYFQLANLLRSAQLQHGLYQLDGDLASQATAARSLALGYFQYEPDTDAFDALPPSPQLALAVRSLKLEPFADEPFALVNLAETPLRTLILVDLSSDERQLWRGFEVDRRQLATYLARAFGADALLPPSLADGAVTNTAIYLSVRDPQGQVLFQTPNQYDPYLRIEREVGDDYQSILAGHRVVASIDPTVADSLVIGGLPRSRLPLLLLVVILTVGLLASAIWLLRREQGITALRSAFVSEVSHELRTPLTQIRMFSEMLLRGRFRDQSEQQRSLQIIHRESQRLSHLVENILSFSRTGKGAVIDRQPIDLKSLTAAVVSEFAAIVPQLEIDSRLDEVTAAVDADAVRQILLNLLDNAAKYAGLDQPVCVTLRQTDNAAQLAVCDRGPGIPATERAKVFGEFYRMPREADNAVAGTGIGLSVVHELVTAHGGQCTISDHPPAGTCITVRLPRQPAT